MSELRVRDVTRSDLPAVLKIRTRSFGPLVEEGAQWWDGVAAEVIPDRMLAVVDDADTILAAGRIRPYEQCWGSRHLQMGGVAGVYVEPSARGQGVGSLLMRGLIARMGELGDVVSCLYPTAPALYRGIGYEVAGTHPKVTYAAHSVRALRTAGVGLRPRPARPDDAELLHRLLREHQVRHRSIGPMLPSVETWRSQLADPEMIHYVLDEVGSTGFVAYSLAGHTLTVEQLVGDTPQATAALWGVVGSGSSAAPRVVSYLDPRDASHLQLEAFPEDDTVDQPWMLRVIDLAKAVAGRGFSPHVSASIDLLVDDPEAPANSAHWRIDVADGVGRAVPVDGGTSRLEGGAGAGPAAYGLPGPGATRLEGGAEATGLDGDAGATRPEGGALRLGARGLAGLWSGWTLSRLRQAGLASGGTPDDDVALDAVFAGTPYLTEYF